MAFAAVLISLLGFCLALLTFRDQRAMNRSQSSINAQEMQRYQRRYVSRLNWRDPVWSHHPHGVRVENRSTATITDVLIIGLDRSVAILPSDVPPCSAMTIDLSGVFDHGVEGAALWRTDMVIMRDPVGVWVKDELGLRLLGQGEFDLLTGLARALHSTEAFLVDLGGTDGIPQMLPLTQAVTRGEWEDSCAEE